VRDTQARREKYGVKEKGIFTTQLSKLSSKRQVTVPKEVREVLDLTPGDMVAYDIEQGTVTLRRAEPFDAAFHKSLSATLDEWETPEDDEAFRDL